MEEEKTTREFAEQLIKEYGMTARTFKSALIWILAESAQPMREEARKILAWQAISDEAGDLKLDDAQKKQLAENVQKARRDLKESIWRAYKYLVLLAKDNTLKVVDLGLVHSSAADSPISNIFTRLSADGDIELKGVSPNFLLRNWSPAFKEWPTKAIRDAFYASPAFPRIPNAEFIKGTIARGIESGMLAYVGKTTSGKYQPFAFKRSVNPSDIEFSDDMFVVTADTAQAYLDQEAQAAASAASTGHGSSGTSTASGPTTPTTPAPTLPTALQPEPTQPTETSSTITGIRWSGDVPPQKWMNFYTKVLSRLVATPGLKLTVHVEISPPTGISGQTVDETKSALRELGLRETLEEL
jgi:hypothetical protein